MLSAASHKINTYTSYDRANRLTAVTDGTTATQYAYDGMGRRISQSVNSVVTQYLLDLQPGLEVVLGTTTGSDTVRNVHGLKGIHAQQDSAGAWNWMLQDGLGSVRSVVDNSLNVLECRLYQPYGVEFGATGTRQTVYSFTGEMRDPIRLQYHRARYLNPALGMFTSLDPFEGVPNSPMSLNGYAYVHGNPVNFVDPTGLYSCAAEETIWSDLPSACSQLDIAYQRAQNVGVSDISSTVENGTVNFGRLKSYIQSNFAFAIAGYSPTIPEGITDCTVTQTLVGVGGAPAKLSLVRTTSALLHVAAYFNQIGIGLDRLRSSLGAGSTIQLVSDAVTFPNGNTI